MITYRTLLSEGKEVLQKAKIMDFEIDAWLLMEFVFQIDRACFFLEWWKKKKQKHTAVC